MPPRTDPMQQVPAQPRVVGAADLGRNPALDGIRALAVAAVLAFHAGLPGAGGGFLGVSVFFTLSGYLITSLLLGEHRRSGGVDLRSFWARRFRRLLPASWLTMGLVVAMGLLGVWDTEQLRALRGDVPWSMAELVNWHFIAGGVSYGDQFSAPSPLEHFWSLAIEQQFYVLLPLVVVGALGWSARRRAAGGRGAVEERGGWERGVGVLAGLVALLAVASAVASGVLARSVSVDRAYFGTDTRAAELLVGVLLACVTARLPAPAHVDRPPGPPLRHAPRPALADAAGVAALVVLGIGVVVARVQDLWLYPAGLLVTSAASVGLVVAASSGGVVARLLAAGPLPAIGRISYGIYLLHWPVFLWLSPERTGWSTVPLLLVRLFVTLAASALMFRLLETPVRTGARLARPATARAAVALAAVALLGATLWSTRDLPPPPSFLQPRAVDDVVIREPSTTTVTPPTTTVTPSTTPAAPTTAEAVPEPPPEPPPPEPPPVRAQRVLFVGDSIAATLEGPLGDELVARGIGFASAIGPGCGLVRGLPAREDGTVVDFTRECDAAVPARQANAVAEASPDLVVALSSWESVDRVVDGVWHPYGSPEAEATLRRLYDETIARLGAGGAAVVIATMPDYVASATRTPNERELAQLRALNALLVDHLSGHPGRVGVVPFAQMVCPTTPCPRVVDGIELRPRDGVHFDDPAGARWAARRLADHLAGLDLSRL